MIYIGYQGIGKSSISNNKNNFIDLESGNFYYNENGENKRDENWYKCYCKIAVHLNEQGYDIFVSSHKLVRDELFNLTDNICLIYPSIDLKDEWIDRLRIRYNKSQSDKDFRALMNAANMYEENIDDLNNDKIINKIIIKDIKYRLEDIIRRI